MSSTHSWSLFFPALGDSLGEGWETGLKWWAGEP